MSDIGSTGAINSTSIQELMEARLEALKASGKVDPAELAKMQQLIAQLTEKMQSNQQAILAGLRATGDAAS